MAGNTPEDFEIELARLRELDLEGLRRHWRTTFGRTASSYLQKPLLLRLLAYRLQAQIHGDLSADTLKFLKGLTVDRKDADGIKSLAPAAAAGLKPGTILVREHDGRTHQVTVVEDGFAWNSKTYSSLSQVAYAITGTKWNGPRFFGLRERGKNIST